MATFVYGANLGKERQLMALSFPFGSQIQPMPWILLGDFNVTRYAGEKVRGDCRWSKAMDDFNECVLKCEVDDLNTLVVNSLGLISKRMTALLLLRLIGC